MYVIMNDCIHKNIRSANSVVAVPYFVKHVCQFGLQLYGRVNIYSSTIVHGRLDSMATLA